MSMQIVCLRDRARRQFDRTRFAAVSATLRPTWPALEALHQFQHLFLHLVGGCVAKALSGNEELQVADRSWAAGGQPLRHADRNCANNCRISLPLFPVSAYPRNVSCRYRRLPIADRRPGRLRSLRFPDSHRRPAGRPLRPSAASALPSQSTNCLRKDFRRQRVPPSVPKQVAKFCVRGTFTKVYSLLLDRIWRRSDWIDNDASWILPPGNPVERDVPAEALVAEPQHCISLSEFQ